MKKTIKALLWVSFIIYCFVLFLVLLSGMRVRRDYMPLGEYIECFTNFIPFRSINDYINQLNAGTIGYGVVKANIVGNLILFFPMGIYLPLLFRRLRKLWKTVSLVFLLILIVESAQLLFKIGSFDIDDFLLNISGAAAGYGLWSIKPVNGLFTKLSD